MNFEQALRCPGGPLLAALLSFRPRFFVATCRLKRALGCDGTCPGLHMFPSSGWGWLVAGAISLLASGLVRSPVCAGPGRFRLRRLAPVGLACDAAGDDDDDGFGPQHYHVEEKLVA